MFPFPVVGRIEALRCLAAHQSAPELRRYAIEEIFGTRYVTDYDREAALRMLRRPRESFGAIAAGYVIFEILTDNGIALFPKEWLQDLPWLIEQCDFTKAVWTVAEVVVWECAQERWGGLPPKSNRIVLEPETGLSLRLSYPALTSWDFCEVRRGIACNLVSNGDWSYDEYLFARNCFWNDPVGMEATTVALHVIKEFLGRERFADLSGEWRQGDRRIDAKIRNAEAALCGFQKILLEGGTNR